jgi:hypothetical protein
MPAFQGQAFNKKTSWRHSREFEISHKNNLIYSSKLKGVVGFEIIGSAYFYCCLCILIVVYVFLLLPMYSWMRLP